MIILNLSKEEKATAVKVAKLFKNMARTNSQFDDKEITFLLISLEIRLGFLGNRGCQTIIVVLESLSEMRVEYPELDPNNEFTDLKEIAEKLKNNPAYQKYLTKKAKKNK